MIASRLVNVSNIAISPVKSAGSEYNTGVQRSVDVTGPNVNIYPFVVVISSRRVLGENKLTTLPAGLFDGLEALQDL